MGKISALDLDRSIYIVIANVIGKAVTVEIDFPDSTKTGAMQRCADFDWEIHHVLCLNPEVGNSRDATAEIADSLAARLFRDNMEPTEGQRRFIDRFGFEYPTEESVSERQRNALRAARPRPDRRHRLTSTLRIINDQHGEAFQRLAD